MKKAAHPLLLAVLASAALLPVFASQHEPIGERMAVQIRADAASVTSAVPTAVTSAAAPTTTHAATSAAASSSSSAVDTTSSGEATSATAASSAASAATTHGSSASSSANPAASAVTTVISSTDAAGQVVTSYVVTTPSASAGANPNTNPSNNSGGGGDGGGGLSTGSIIGLSVSGGIAALAIILFFVWKFTRKRFADFDDNEAIKWPELNAHNNDVHALPTHSTGRAGFGPENDSELNLTRPSSPGGTYTSSLAAASVPEVYGAGDPYAVPPLPHLNPNQPYRDEPGAYGPSAGFYDPYRGPVPNTFTDTISDTHGTESIPMTQMARVRSPGPQVAYDMQGRGSPAPQAAMGYAGLDERSRTPVLAPAAGRASPGPHPGYGYGPR